MSSILTNNGAMVALQTMKSITKNMGQVQQQISTGKSVSTAKDNAAVWAISKTMESDVKGFKGISSSLALGSSTIAVARTAAEEITELLSEVKDKIVASQEDNTDRSKIQSDVAALRDQIGTIVGAAQFNGLNLLSNCKSGALAATLNTGKVNILSSLNRTTSGVTSANITVEKQDLGVQARSIGATTVTGAFTPPTAVGISATTTATWGINGDASRGGPAIQSGDSFAFGGLTGITTASYVARDGDTATDVAKALVERVNYESKKAGLTFTAELDTSTATPGVKLSTTSGAFTTSMTAFSGGTAGGGLEILRDIDVSTSNGAIAALSVIEGLTQTAIQAAADFGTAQRRIDVQSSFVNNLVDALKSGIGSMVDADMEETSARLQALQVQQQLATQSLSIANQAPQNILSLFR